MRYISDVSQAKPTASSPKADAFHSRYQRARHGYQPTPAILIKIKAVGSLSFMNRSN